jgi:phytoene synthase
LNQYYNDWKSAFDRKDFEDQKFGKYVKLFEEHKIPFEYSKSFFDSMIMDCSVFRYKNYEQVNIYMYGSAAVVGLMMCSVM